MSFSTPEATTTFLSVSCRRQWGDFEQLLDYGNIRYHLLLVYNRNPRFYYCAENVCLRALYDALSVGDTNCQRACARCCINLFWATLKRDYAARQYMGPSSDQFVDMYTATNSPVIKLQAATTGRQVGMEFSIHSSTLKYPTTGSIKNIYPQVPIFLRKYITIREVLPRDIFNAEIAGRDYWLKTAYHYHDEASFSRELESLMRAPVHPTILQLIGVVVDATNESRIDGIVLGPRVAPKQLNWIKRCTRVTGAKWKSQIAGAIARLHASGTVWGWAIEDNVVIDGFGNATVIDFSGGPGKVSVEGDLEGQERIFRFVDDLVDDNYSDDDFEAVEGFGGGQCVE